MIKIDHGQLAEQIRGLMMIELTDNPDFRLQYPEIVWVLQNIEAGKIGLNVKPVHSVVRKPEVPKNSKSLKHDEQGIHQILKGSLQ